MRISDVHGVCCDHSLRARAGGEISILGRVSDLSAESRDGLESPIYAISLRSILLTFEGIHHTLPVHLGLHF